LAICNELRPVHTPNTGKLLPPERITVMWLDYIETQ